MPVSWAASHVWTEGTERVTPCLPGRLQKQLNMPIAVLSAAVVWNILIKLKAAELQNQAAIRGWDQRRLARACGASEATISRAMSGHGVRRATLLRILRALQDAQPIPELQKLVGDSNPDSQ